MDDDHYVKVSANIDEEYEEYVRLAAPYKDQNPILEKNNPWWVLDYMVQKENRDRG